MSKNYLFSAKLGGDLSNTPVYTNHVVSQSSQGYKRYYSKIDAKIYLGNSHIDDVVDIEWDVIQQQLPIYGYNSYTYDEIALGSRIICGYFTIAFTSPNYLNDIIQIASQVSLDAITTQKIKTDDALSNDYYNNTGQVNTNDKTSAIWKPSFDIDIVFGEKNMITGNSCHIIIEGVKLASSQASAGSVGGVLCESYKFIGKDIRNIK